MANIKDILLVSGCKIRTDEYIDGNHRLAKKIVAKKSTSSHRSIVRKGARKSTKKS